VTFKNLKILIGFSLVLAACWYAGNSAEAGNRFLAESDASAFFFTRSGSPRLLHLAQAGTSQINPNVPIQGSSLSSAPIRSNFAAAQSDVNNIYSILTGTSTGQMLQSVTNGAPLFSTATWPSTTTINQILYSSANNAVVGLPTVNNAFLVTNSSGQPGFSTTVPASAIPFPTVSTLGGVLSSTCAANTWINQLNTSGVFVCTQPGFSNLSGSATLSQFPSIGANTVIANFTASSTIPTGFTIGSCSTTSSALNYTSGTGIGCNTALAALNVAQNWTAVQTFNNNDIALKGSSTGTTAFASANTTASNFTITFPAATDTVGLIGTAQTFTAVKTFTNSDLALLGSSTGATTFASANTTASNFTLTFPAVTDTTAVLGTAQTWTGAQTFTNNDLILLGSSTGSTTFHSANSGASNFTLTFPAVTDTTAVLGTVQTWTAAQTFTNSDLILKGSSTGATTFASANSGASNFTLTFPAATDTVDLLGTAQTFTAAKTFTNSDLILLGSSTGFTTFRSANSGASNFTLTFPAVTDTTAVLGTVDQVLSGGMTLTVFSIGTESSGTFTVDCGKNPVQYLLNGGAFTLAAPANDGACLVQSVQGPSAGTITLSGFSTSPSGTGDTVTTANTTSATVTISNASPAVITWTQSFVNGQAVYFTTSGSLPTGLTASQIYYVINTTGTAFNVAATPGGAAINTSSAGSGTQTGHEPAIFTANIFRVNGLSNLIWKQQQ
jgi:hypothetical protein